MTLPDARARVERLLDEALADLCHLPDPKIRQWAEQDAAALSRVLAELDRLPRLREALPTLEQLRRIEWSGGHIGRGYCVACHAPVGGQHLTDCWIARLTAALETP